MCDTQGQNSGIQVEGGDRPVTNGHMGMSTASVICLDKVIKAFLLVISELEIYRFTIDLNTIAKRKPKFSTHNDVEA